MSYSHHQNLETTHNNFRKKNIEKVLEFIPTKTKVFSTWCSLYLLLNYIISITEKMEKESNWNSNLPKIKVDTICEIY